MQTSQIIRTYSELILLPTYEERFEYLKLSGSVAEDTFGADRYFNQQFYRSAEWKKIRDQIIIRDGGCDMGLDGFVIYGRVLIHHMNPIRMEDIRQVSEYLTNPEYLICVSNNTHQAIHYGDIEMLARAPKERSKFDTCPWRRCIQHD